MKNGILILLFVLCYGQSNVYADDSFNGSPYSTVYTHLHYLQTNEYDPRTSSRAFNIKNTREAERLSIQLKQIFDGKGIFIKLENVPDNPDFVDSTKRRMVYILHPKLPQVYLQKIGGKWYYSKETIEAIPGLYKDVYPFGSVIWVKLFPYQSEHTFLKLHYWQWIGFTCILGIFFIAYFLIRFISYRIIKKIVEYKISYPFDDLNLLKIIANSFSLMVGFLIVQLVLPTLLLTTKLSASLTKAVSLVSAIVFVYLLYKLTEVITQYFEQISKKSPIPVDTQIVQLLKRISKLFIIIFGIFYILRIFDVNLTTVIAGISIGGLSIALASQDTIKNFIGSIVLFIDKPFKVGDTISGDNFEGVVHEVGFRSSRIKTADDSVIAVANGKLADMTIDNKGQRVFKKFKTTLYIPFDTQLYKLEYFIEGIRILLNKYPYVKNNSIDVFLTDIQEKGMSITVSYKYKVYNHREELQHREFILLHILRLAEILQVKLFEQNQLLIEAKELVGHEMSKESLKLQLDKFFTDYSEQLPK